jgi:hypothetical protein
LGSTARAARFRYLLPVLVVLGLLAWQHYHPATPTSGPAVSRAPAHGDSVRAAYAARRSGVWLETGGRVLRVLPDDNAGSRHQRMILDTGGVTVLVAHNIDLAGRVPVSTGDRLTLRGRYEWNDQGGVMHWTHHDPQGHGAGGWIRRDGRLYR